MFQRDVPTSWGPNILLGGDSGTGKTHSCRTLIQSGIKVFSIFTEPRWMPLADISCEEGFHLHYIPPVRADWSAIKTRYSDLTTLPWETNIKMVDKNKKLQLGFVQVVETLEKYTCDKCGETFGDVTEFGPEGCVWLDSLTGMNKLAMAMVAGKAVSRSQPQWGAAQSAELDLIDLLTNNCPSWFVLVAHLEKLEDTLHGGFIIQVNALGKAIAPEIPVNFDDFVVAERKGDKFSWSNANSRIATKPGYLPISDNLPQDFGQIVKAWERVQGK